MNPQSVSVSDQSAILYVIEPSHFSAMRNIIRVLTTLLYLFIMWFVESKPRQRGGGDSLFFFISPALSLHWSSREHCEVRGPVPGMIREFGKRGEQNHTDKAPPISHQLVYQLLTRETSTSLTLSRFPSLSRRSDESIERPERRDRSLVITSFASPLFPRSFGG